MHIYKTTFLDVRKYCLSPTCIKYCVYATTYDIGHSQYASDVACANQLGDIDPGIRVSLKPAVIGHGVLA